jgi:hypothetical protein
MAFNGFLERNVLTMLLSRPQMAGKGSVYI